MRNCCMATAAADTIHMTLNISTKQCRVYMDSNTAENQAIDRLGGCWHEPEEVPVQAEPTEPHQEHPEHSQA